MNAHQTRLQALLDRFDAVRAARPGPYRWSSVHRGDEHDKHIVFSSIIHGDEVGPMTGLIKVMEALHRGALRFGGTATFLLGNPEASAEDTRFLESDLNRVFLQDVAPQTHEERRAHELMPLLDQADVYLDFHQTIKPTKRTFYIFPWSEAAGQWVRALAGADVWVTRNPDQAFSAGMMCADEYVRARGVPGITLELGEMGWQDSAAETAERVLGSAMALLDDIEAGRQTLAQAAAGQPAIDCWETVFRQQFTDPTFALREGLVNFDPVEEGELLSAPGTPELRAPRSGAVLFPKYPPRGPGGEALAPRPGEIYRLVAPVQGDPAALWG